MTSLSDLIQRVRKRDRTRGQSVVELALLAPVVLLILMVGLDFGRVFLGWVNLNNTARIAANFAATNAIALSGTGPLHDAAIDRYELLIENDATTINCQLPDPIPEPTFPSGTELGDPAHVAIDCDFGILTPIISNLMGSPVRISASADFPVRSGIVATSGSGGGGVDAAFNISPVSGVGSAAVPLIVTFTDLSTGGPMTYAWDFNGDGVTDSTQAGNTPPLTFPFTIPDVYFASLTVTNGTDTDTATQLITVTGPPGPVVNFTATPFVGAAPLDVSFNENASGDNPLTFAWDFGDGSAVSNQPNPNHTYSSAGTYTVTLTVTDVNLLSNAGTKTVTVSPPIAMCTVPDFTIFNTADDIQQKWIDAGFDTTVIFNPTRPPDYDIKKQDLNKNTSQPCLTAVQTVYEK